MADWYCRSGATGTGAGTSWANAFTSIAANLATLAAGDNLWVSEDHAESTTTGGWANLSTIASPIRVICANHSGSVPPVSADLRTTATVTTTSNAVIQFNNDLYVYGIGFTAASGGTTVGFSSGNAAGCFQVFENCGFTMAASGAAVFNMALNARAHCEYINCTFAFNATSQNLTVAGSAVIKGGSVGGSTFPTNLLVDATAGIYMLLDSVDLSALGSNTICAVFGGQLKVLLRNCKLGSSAVIGQAPTIPGAIIEAARCDSAAHNYRTEKYEYMGTQTTETTIVRTGGASDGTTPISWKVITTANAKRMMPFDTTPISIWNDTVGSSITITLFGIWGGGSVPNNDNIWIDAEYPGSTGSPLGSIVSAGPVDQLIAGSALSSDGSTWGGSTTPFKMSVTLTPQMKGPINLRVLCADPSTTFYVDPLPSISGVTVAKSYAANDAIYINELSAGAAKSYHIIGG